MLHCFVSFSAVNRSCDLVCVNDVMSYVHVQYSVCDQMCTCLNGFSTLLHNFVLPFTSRSEIRAVNFTIS